MVINLRFRVTIRGLLRLPVLLSQMVLRMAKLHILLEFTGNSNEHKAEEVSIVGW